MAENNKQKIFPFQNNWNLQPSFQISYKTILKVAKVSYQFTVARIEKLLQFLSNLKKTSKLRTLL